MSIQYLLDTPTQSFERDLESFKADPSKYNLEGDPPLHALVSTVVDEDSREKKQKLMILLLRYTHLYVNLWKVLREEISFAGPICKVIMLFTIII